MARYVDVEGFSKLFDAEYKKTRELIEQGETHLDNLAEGFLEADRVIRNLPTADVAEVKHGKWAHIGGDEWCCTNCGEVITTEGSWEAPTKKYCNECGAKMDGERSDT